MLGGTTQRYHDVMALCVDSHDNIFVAERAAVLAFNPHGEFVRAIASPDLSAMFINRAGVPVFVRKGGWQLENNPLAPLAVPQQGAQPKPVEDVPSAVETSRGEWLIADRKAKMVQLFSSGKYVRSMASGIEAERLALNDVDDLAMLDRENKMVVVADREGKILRRIARRGAGWALENPVDLAFDAMGHLYVLDRDKATVFVFAPDGKLLVSFAVPEKAPGAFERASALGVDSAARLYIFDEHTQHVHIYQ
jgi:hypothetical protein